MSFELMELERRLEEVERQVFDLVANTASSDDSDFNLEQPNKDYHFDQTANEHEVPVKRFYITALSDTSVRVFVGGFTRNGTPVASSQTDLGSLTDGPYYITGTLSSSTRDPNLIPDTLTITAPTTLPIADTDETNYNNIAIVFGKITCADSKISIIEPYRVGDLDDIAITPDANTNDVSVTPYSRSIQANPDETYHQKELQLYNFYNGTEFGGVPDTTNDYVVMRDANRANADGPDIIYTNRANFADWVEGAIDGTQLGTQPQHTKLGYNIKDGNSADKEGNTDHDWRYPILGQTSVDVFFRSIGRVSVANTKTLATPILAIDLANMRLYDTATTYTIDWNLRKLRRGNGAEHVNWEVVDGTRFLISDVTSVSSTIGDNALQCPGSGYFGNGVFVHGDGQGGVWFQNGQYIWDNGSAIATSVMLSSAADFSADASTDLGNSTYNWDNVYGTTFYSGANQGQSVGSQLAGGINYGATHEVRADALQPGDMILVRR